MSDILLAVFVFTLIFGVDYLFFLKDKSNYQYVSRRTLILFLLGQIAIIALFWGYFETFVANYKLEFFYLTILLAALVGFSYSIQRDRLLVCHLSSRTERCLTPYYVIVKGTEIVFQQLVYLVVALSLVNLMSYTLLTFIAFIQILLIMHTPVILSCNKLVISRLTFGIGVIAAPILFIFIDIGYFFPAVYLHSLMYVFYWVTFADFENSAVENSG